MKKFLLSLTLFAALLGVSLSASAQCSVSNLSVNVNSITTNENGTCTVNFDLSWQQETNNGNKYAYVHLWSASTYHTPTSSWTSNMYKTSGYPTRTELVNTLMNFVIEDNGTFTPYLGNTYYPDPTVTVNSTAVIVKTNINSQFDRVEIQNINLSFPNCNIALDLKGDVWATNAENKKNVQCVSQGLAVTLNDPRITGFKRCSVPRTYDVTISTTSSTPLIVFYNVYKDDGDGIFEPGGADQLIDTKNGISVSAAAPYSAANVTYPGSGDAGEKANLWLEVKKSNTSAYSTTVFLENGCAVLPVTYKSFTANRSSNSQVVLEWETAMEENNRGFHVQRNVDGNWKNIGFVFSQADGGNSSAVLKYAFKDANSHKGISQYRVLQVDMDGKGKYSEVRAVRGEEMAARLTLYPNPSTTGSFTLLFEDAASVRDVIVSDVSGRTVKQFKGVSNGSLTVDNLDAGFYTVQVLNRTNGAVATEKVIIKKR